MRPSTEVDLLVNTDIRYKPAFLTIFLTLNPGESIIAEAGAMTSMDAQLSIRTEFSGGFIPGLLNRLKTNLPCEQRQNRYYQVLYIPEDTVSNLTLPGDRIVIYSGLFKQA